MNEPLYTLFLEALRRPPGAERIAFLDRACEGDADRRRQIDGMLAEGTAAEAFFDGPETAGSSLGGIVTGEKPGDVIGRFKLLQVIGEGGFGTVWMAEQSEPVQRRVALKIIRLGMDTRECVARFEQERQALAVMDHPNIARVLDGGATPSGRPFFVMELVRGVPITKFCDDGKLSLTERLELFIQVCHAIQHAHQKGIIHRDIKPSNILVSVGGDGEPVPRVIDFGVAKAMDRALTDKTLFTQFEQMIGTPAYMSPEQVGAGPMDIDTRSDVYALGVLLYEILAGRPPFDPDKLLKAGLDEMRRVIREEEPPRPSTRLGSMVRAQLAGLATTRHTQGPKLLSTIKGDLDWIVMKALEKNRTRRYETASGFAADVARYLRDEPVVARPPSFGYRAGKFIRKHKGAVSAAAAVVVTLLAGVTAATILYLGVKAALGRESVQRTKAETESLKNAQTAQFLNEMLASISPDEARGADLELMKRILARAADRVGTDLQGQPEVEAFLRHTIGSTYFTIGLNKEAKTQFEAGLKVASAAFGPDARLTLNFRGNLANLMYARHDYAAAEAENRAILLIRTDRFSPKDPETLATRFNLANALAKQRRHKDAEHEYLETSRLQQEVLGADAPDTLRTRLALANSLRELATTNEQLKQAEEEYRAAIAAGERSLAQTTLLEARYGLGDVLHAQKEYGQAEVEHRAVFEERTKLLRPPHKKTLQSQAAVARAVYGQGRLDDAATLFREALETQKASPRADPEDMVMNGLSLAAILGKLNKHAEAEEALRPLIVRLTELTSPDNPAVLISRTNLAIALAAQRKFDEAEAEQIDVLKRQERALPRGHPDIIRSMENLARIKKQRGKTNDARELEERAATLKRAPPRSGK